MSLIQKIHNPGPDAFYDPGFRVIFEDHLSWIINNEIGSIETATVDANTAARYAGDWRGLMMELGVFPQMHWFNMRLNGYTSCTDYLGDETTLSLLNIAVVDRLIGSFKTVRKN